MTWDEARKKFPGQWVVVEARSATSVGGKTVDLPIALIDTGSAGTLVNADRLLDEGVTAEPTDRIGSVRGIGGVEYVLRAPGAVIDLGRLELTGPA